VAPKADDPLIGKILGDYEIKRLLGKGGMSNVYLASDTSLDREAAIKVITLERDRAKELMKRFQREARVVSKLKHPNIITIYSYGTDEGTDTHYFAMEYVNGGTLTQKLGRHKNKNTYMEYDEIIAIMRQMADALDYAHAKGVIHRDIKPSNIMLEKDTERAVLMDFGLLRDIVNDSTLGTAFGTPRYIAPEQAISSQQAVPASDLYSLAVVIFEMLTGKVPFDDESAMSLALSHITNPPPSPREVREDLPEEAANVILRALEKEPSARYPSAVEMVEALAEALGVGGEPKHAVTYTKTVIDKSVVGPAPATSAPPTPKPQAKASKRSGKAQSPPETKQTPDKPDKKEARRKKQTPAQAGGAKAKQRTFPRMLVLLLLVLLLGGGAGVFFLLSSGDDDEAAADDSTTIRLIYDDESMTVYNASNKSLDITGMTFYSPNEIQHFETRDIGVDTLAQFVPEKCALFFIRNQRPEPPEVCPSEDPPLKEVTYLEKQRSDNLYWVWLSTLENQEFHVMRVTINEDGEEQRQLIKTCLIGPAECSFEWPEISQVADSEDDSG
jgi:serine/threonine-protein kinase